MLSGLRLIPQTRFWIINNDHNRSSKLEVSKIITVLLCSRDLRFTLVSNFIGVFMCIERRVDRPKTCATCSRSACVPLSSVRIVTW
jgi:hypothetical protein